MIRQISVAAIAAVFGCASAYAARPPVHEATRSNLDLSFPTATAAVGDRSLGLEGAPAKARKLLSSQRRLGSVGLHSSFNEALGTPSFLWARAGLTASAPLSLQRRAMVEYGGRDALGKQASLLGIHQADIDSARLVQLHDLGGAIVTAYQQRVGGYDVFGRRLAVAMSQQFRVVATSGSFAPLSAADRLAAPAFDWSAPRAIAAAFADLGGSISAGLIRPSASVGDYTLHTVRSTGQDYRMESSVRSKPVLFPLDGRLLPAYYTEVRAATADGHRQDYYGYVISAADGQVLFRKNLTQHDAFTYRALADTASPFQPFDHPLGNETFPVPSLDPSTVYVRSPASSAFVSVENSPIEGVAVPRPWLAAGATVTSGNNVDAYADLNSPDGLNGSDFRAAVTSAGVFDYPVAIDTTPTTTIARNAAIVNLFYMNNWLHDFWYGAGFDEAAGNAQSSNFGLGGVAGDPIHAEGQDFSGTNNANMSTPADGSSPRMQMYLFDGIFDGALSVVAPAPDDLAAAPAAFGAATFDLTGQVVAYLDATGSTTDACEAASNAAALAGKIALLDRGSCDFVVKVKNAQNAGAVGAVVVDNVPGEKPFTMGGDDASITIPALMTMFEDGASVRVLLDSGPVSLRMLRNASTPLDGTLDNGIIAHEFFHYVSNRLVNDGSGLLNNQGGSMGEGWGDFSALMLAVRAEDSAIAGNEQYQGAYSMGYYVLDDLYFGIRRAPYSTSFAINPLTFEHIENGVPLPDTAPFGFGTDGASNAEVHNAGEVWAVTLWEAYAALLNNPLYSFTDAQSRMKKYVIEGLMMTPTNPTFLEARDAILAAADATDAVDFELINKAFARRGMGVYALAPPAGSINHVGVVQSFVEAVPTVAAAEAYIDLSGSLTPDDNCDSDTVLDLGEVARFVLRLPINGSVPLSDGTIATVSSADPVVLGNGGELDLQPDGSGYLEGEISIALSAATGSVELSVVLSDEEGDAAIVVFGNGEPAFTAATHYDLALDLSQDGMETAATQAQWSTARSGNSAPWQLTDFGTTTGFGWWAPSSDELAEQYLTSPAIDVTTIGPFVLDFDHYYAFSEADSTGEVPVGLDGGVIEVSVDGAAWQDVQTLGTFTAGGYTGLVTTPDGNREGYVGTNRVQGHVTIDFGSNVAGSTIRLRFRTFSDDGDGDFGWLVDNVAAGDAAYPPFGSVVDENGVCSTAVPTANAGKDFTVPAFDAVSGQPTVVKLTGTASDADADAVLAYSWTRIAGPEVVLSGADTLTPTFTAPQLEANTSLTFQLAVTDGATEVFDTVTVKVIESKPPVADAGDGQKFTGPVTVTLDGSGSSDPSGEAITLLWTKTAGPDVTLSDPTSASPSFTTSGGNYTFTLTVTDPQGNQATDSVNVLVHIPPSATAPADFAQDERVAGTAQLSTVTLTGTANNPEDTDTYTYLWQQIGGTPTVTLANANSKVASFTAPAVKSDTPLTFRFAVQGKEKVSSDDVTVTIEEVDVAPVANAGPAQSLLAIAAVQLDGSASSDPDGTLAAYAWSQTGGPTAALSDGAVPKPTFTATLGGTYAFTLTVTDDEGLSASSSVAITVANPVPTVNAGTDSTVLVGTIVLNGSATDANGAVVTYAWTQLGGPAATITDADKASAGFTAATPGTYSFRLTAADNEGASSADDVVVTVQSAPTADAGADASATTGTAVTLDGSGSTDVDGDIAYAWTAVSGPAVSLVDATSEDASFTPSAAGTYVFKLVVTDDDGLSDEDQVSITVTQAPSSGGGGGGGGAAGGLLIAVMLAGAALRRRQRGD